MSLYDFLDLCGPIEETATSLVLVHASVEGALPVYISAEKSRPGGASHHYRLQVPGAEDTHLKFQFGGQEERGQIPGISNEALLAVVMDRLGDFQEGSFACEENGKALAKLEDVMTLLENRTSRLLEAGTP